MKVTATSSFILHPSSFLRHPRCVWLAFTTLLALSCLKRETPRPNVLLITLDTFRADRLGPLTSNLNKLAEGSTRFDDATSAVPLTLPSHATILSGLLPLHHGLRNNGAGIFPQNRETLASLFSAAGYRTGAFVSAFVLDHRFGLNRGFETYDDAIARDPNSNSNYDAERRGAETVDHALAWLAHRATPFFAWVHLYDAHAPYAPPAPYPQTYDGEIAYVDAQVGRLIASVDLDRTIVAVVGDHGESLGEHGELTHGLLLYQPTLHVPMFIHVPGIDAAVLRAAVSSADLATTLSSLALQQTMRTDGVDLSENVRRHREPATHLIYAESEYSTMFGWSDLAAMRSDATKLIQSTAPELYALDRDPHETQNAIADDRRAFRKLSDSLAALERTAVASTPTTVDDETRAKLASLGYVAPSSNANNRTAARPSPAAMAPLFRAFEEANAATNAGRPQNAIPKLRAIVERDPRNSVFRGSLAHALRAAGHLDEAIALSKEAVALNPNDEEAWYNLAVTLQEAGRTAESVQVIREAIRRNPQRGEAHNELGIALVEEEKLQEAKEEFAKAIAIEPRDARAHTNLANVLRAEGDLDGATREYDEALELAPNYVDALNGRGAIEVQRERPRNAIPYFDRALAIAPQMYDAQLNRGIALQLSGDVSAAKRQFESLLASMPRSPQFEPQRRAASQLLSQLQRMGGS